MPFSSTRRAFIFNMVAGLAAAAALRSLPAAAFSFTKSDADWQAQLTPLQYNILRHEGTEPPYSSALNGEHRAGTFACAGCSQPLFSSGAKFDSGTGWPSFYEALPGAVLTATDYKLLLPRTEYHCSRCGGHHGHVFTDGPQPTGLRYCSNGAVLSFMPLA